jgi:uncharacterized protein YdeI (BOF family)
MKKLILAIAVAAFSTATFAQAQTDKKMETKPAQGSEAKMTSPHCYTMKDNAMMECWGAKAQAMKKDATLKNGTMVSTKGEVTMKDGKKSVLTNGQCIMANNGMIGDFAKMHPEMKMEKKAEEKK